MVDHTPVGTPEKRLLVDFLSHSPSLQIFSIYSINQFDCLSALIPSWSAPYTPTSIPPCSFFNTGIDSKHHLPLHLWCISQHGTVQSSAALLTEFFVFRVREEVFLHFMLSFQMLPTILCQLACLFAIGNAQLPNYANNEVGRSINKPFSNFVDLPSQRLKAWKATLP